MKKLLKQLLLCSGLVLALFAISAEAQAVTPADMGDASHAKISLSRTRATLGSVMKEIQAQTGLEFFYNDVVVDTHKKVDLHVTDATLEEVLVTLFDGEVRASVVNGLIVLSKAEGQQQDKITVQGTVLDSEGLPVVGAIVVVKDDTSKGSSTDLDGRFRIAGVPTNATLRISYVGMKTAEVAVQGTTPLQIVLQPDSELLDEVVVVGYGTQKKANLIGAVSSVSGESLKDRPATSVGQMLQGQVPNLNVTFASGRPGESTSMNIRGATSIINSGAPLVLIDGVEGSIDRVNPNDIESISILKDAASAAIYGARAGFGVILVTTKRSKDNQFHITYGGRFSFSKPTVRTDFVTTGYDAARIADAFNKADSNSSYTGYTNADYAELEARKNDVVEDPSRPWVVQGADGRYRYYGNFDWYNYLFDFSQPTWTHNLSMSGGSEAFNYMVSASMNDKRGIYAINSDKYDTKTFSAKFFAKAASWLDLSAGASLFKSNYKSPGYDFEDGNNFGNLMFHALAFVMPYNPDGSNVYTYAPKSNRPADGVAAMLRQGDGFSQVQKTETVFNLSATAHVIDGLDVVGAASYKRYNKEKTFRQAPFTYSERPEEYKSANSGFFQNRLKEINSSNEILVFDLFANYSKVFGSHNLNVVTGLNHELGHYKNVEASSFNILSSTLNDLNLGTGNKGAKGGQHEYALLGFFGRASYDYEGKYLTELNVRYDGTSRFPKDSRWGLFPSIAFGWRISDEPFFAPLRSQVDNLKLRYSIGSLGNQVTDGYRNPYYPFIRRAAIKDLTDQSYIFNNRRYSYTKLDDPVSGGLTWETIVTQNVGLDLGLFGNRLNLTTDVYNRETRNMLAASMTLPDVYGYSAPLENNGCLRTKGYEVVLSWNDRFTLLNKPFSYGVSLSLADSKSVLVKYEGNDTKILDQNYEGKEWGEIWGFKVEGLYQSDEEVKQRGVDQSFINSRFTNKAGDLIFADIDGSKKIDIGKGTLDDHGDLQKIGNRMPRYHYGANIHMSWYGVDFSMFIQGVGKQNLYPGGDNNLFWGPYSRSYISFITKDFEDKVWTPETPNSYFPRPAANLSRWNNALARVNDRYLQDLAYCRLKNLTVGYTLPSELTQKVMLQNARIYFSGENLYTFTKLKSEYLDPEQMTRDGNGRVYPFSMTFSFGVDLTF